jgi:hypothetical protein
LPAVTRILPVKLSISDELRAGRKPYLRHLVPHGYEMGVGRRGKYDAHGHLGFTDLAFAPGGLRIHHSGATLAGKLHLSAPGTWFGPIEFLSDFWFVKFFQFSADKCSIPDKVTDRSLLAREGCLVADELEAVLPFWRPGGAPRYLGLSIRPDELRVTGLDGPDTCLTISA